ncbi:hypothetical protein [Streptomyces sp. JV178]|uniref:hypothetical protein n=1 Tax=Streptomyces sp. JV178 TaxID=858632 RepID=UPI0015D53548|nr:hypothetical protein [Streptomyces sp. JV178]
MIDFEPKYGNVEKLEAPIHAVLTAEDAQAYKPRYQAFEYIKHKVFVSRGYELGTPAYGYHQVDLLSQVPPLLGL